MSLPRWGSWELDTRLLTLSSDAFVIDLTKLRSSQDAYACLCEAVGCVALDDLASAVVALSNVLPAHEFNRPRKLVKTEIGVLAGTAEARATQLRRQRGAWRRFYLKEQQ